MNTFAARRATQRTTGHYRKPGTDRSHCGRDLDHTPTPAEQFLAICKACAKTEARDRAEAEAVADSHREGAAEQALAQSLTPKMREVLPAVVAAVSFRDTGLANLPKGVTDPSLQALIRRGLAEKYDTGETFVGFEGRIFKVMHYRATDLGRTVATVLTADQAEAPAVQAAPVATNAFEQGTAGLLDAPRPGRYQLRVCEAPRDVCERGLCRTTSTRAAGTLDEVRAAATMFRHAWPVDEQGNPVEDDDQATAEPLSVEALVLTVVCPTCRVAAGARCITGASKLARESHGRRFEALEQAAGITQHRAAARREAEARGGWLTCLDRKAEGDLLTAYAARINARAQLDDDQALAAEATEGTWQGAWIGERQAADALFDVDRATEQGALFDGRAAQ
ncbi:hypothetical protein ACFY0P_36805 [Streptomyces sp. NPDC001714]|uniref:zinc finger domain-containing protein n=1 Tax=Streptomyces sp. NPDC001714 TaxID=3364603 RepID=UPI0036B97257